MAADGAVMPFGRVPPAGSPILPPLLRAGRAARSERPLKELLERRLGVDRVELYASGREALRVGLRAFADRTGRSEAIVPAYTCYSVPSAVVAAGLRVRLVDVDERGRIDPLALAKLPLDRCAAVVVCNLFGLAEPVAPLAETARAAEVAIVDDAAQALGAVGGDGPAGGRGDVGVLSFGRGKPLAALGGGALLFRGGSPDVPPMAPAPATPLAALAKAAAHDGALHPWAFRVLAGIPALHVGESRFEPEFPAGGIDGAALVLAAAAVREFERVTEGRVRRAEALARRIAAETDFEPLVAPAGERGAHPRLAVLAPSAAAREDARERLEGIGAGVSCMYPASLDAVPSLQPHLADGCACPAARDLAARILTLPTHGRLAGATEEDLVRALAGPRRNREAVR